MNLNISRFFILSLLVISQLSIISEAQRTENKCGRCSSPCKVVSGIYAKRRLTSFGAYNKILEIPEGACSINISEVIPSSNFLALRSGSGRYILNGNFQIRLSGKYPALGTTFHYKRQRGKRHGHIDEAIRANGPIDEALHLMVIFLDDNRGIKYQYSIPSPAYGRKPKEDKFEYMSQQGGNKPLHNLHYKITKDERKKPNEQRGRPVEWVYPTPSHQNRHRYNWFTGGLTRCSADCAGGIQTQEILCQEANTGAIVTDENCDPHTRPQVHYISCNKHRCPPSWEIWSNWTLCTRTCGPGYQERKVQCMVRISATQYAPVSATKCANKTKPSSLRSCNVQPCGVWKIGDWSSCTECGVTWRTRSVKCVNERGTELQSIDCSQPRPKQRAKCRSTNGDCWYSTKWIGECDGYCNGQFERTVVCLSKSNAKSDQCDVKHKPDAVRDCRSEVGAAKYCGGVWFTSPWTECSTACLGSQNRDVMCMKRYGSVWYIVKEDECPSQKPEDTRTCAHDRCFSQWYTTPWEKCSRTCGQGERRRKAVCLDRFHTVSRNCEEKNRPSLAEQCNLGSCDQAQRSPAYKLEKTTRQEKQKYHIQTRTTTSRASKTEAPTSTTTSTTTPPATTTTTTERTTTRKRRHKKKKKEKWNSDGHAHGVSEGQTIGEKDGADEGKQESCKDNFSQCKLANAAGFCKFAYYQDNCCKSCGR